MSAKDWFVAVMDILNTKAVKTAIRGLFVIIGLFAVAWYSLKAFELHYAYKSAELCHKDIYGVSYIKGGLDVINILKVGEDSGSCILAAGAIKCNPENATAYIEQLEELFVLISKNNLRGCESCLKRKILWVGKNPDIFQSEKEILAFHGIEIKGVSNANNAIDILKKDNTYIAIIYASESKNDNSEKNNFRTKVNENCIETPFFEFVPIVK
jgi:hypothetical protein